METPTFGTSRPVGIRSAFGEILEKTSAYRTSIVGQRLRRAKGNDCALDVHAQTYVHRNIYTYTTKDARTWIQRITLC